MPLKLRRADLQYPKVGWPPSEDYLVVMHGETVVGSLQRIDGGPSHDRWSWSITAVYVPPSTISSRGTADSKEDAKAAFAKTFRDWLSHVGADDLTEEVLAMHCIGSRRF
jgi:hypothetical protein